MPFDSLKWLQANVSRSGCRFTTTTTPASPRVAQPEESFIPRVMLHGGPAEYGIHYEKEPLTEHASLEYKSIEHAA